MICVLLRFSTREIRVEVKTGNQIFVKIYICHVFVKSFKTFLCELKRIIDTNIL